MSGFLNILEERKRKKERNNRGVNGDSKSEMKKFWVFPLFNFYIDINRSICVLGMKWNT